MKALVALVATLGGCNQLLGEHAFSTSGDGDAASDGHGDDDATDPCVMQGRPSTTISGTVFAPNGMLPIDHAAVYAPTEPVSTIPPGVGKTVCVSGKPTSVARSDSTGHFTVSNVPAGDVSLVIQVGKWRRQLVVPNVQACQDNPVPPERTRLPKNGNEGDLPQFVVATGFSDQIECVFRQIGLEDAEFVAGPSTLGHVHMFVQPDQAGGVSVLGGAALPTTTTLYANMAPYDVVLFGCPGGNLQEPTLPLAASLQNWTNTGGWLFLTHFGFAWLQKGPAPWATMGTFLDVAAPTNPTVSIDTSTPAGASFSAWMKHVGGSSTDDQFPLVTGTGRMSCSAVDGAGTRRMFLDPALNTNTTPSVQGFTWDATNGGRVVWNDVHAVAGTTTTGQSFPTECPTGTITPQQLAVIHQLFETPTCERP